MRSHVPAPSSGSSGESTKVKIHNFGSTDVPHVPTIGDERYFVNPSVPYPSRSQQEAVHYSAQLLKGGYDPSTSRGVLGHLPKRKLPPHLFMRSRAGTPDPRIGKDSRRSSNANRPKSAEAMFAPARMELTAATTDVA